MPVTRQQTLCKAERLNGKKQVDSLFMGGTGRAMSIYPIRMIYAIGQCDAASREPQAKIMVSVPKRYFKRAVKRNRVNGSCARLIGATNTCCSTCSHSIPAHKCS